MGADPADWTPVAVGEEVLRFGVLEERVAALIKELLYVHQERGDPFGLIAVEPPRQLDEGVQLTSGDDRANLDAHRYRQIPCVAIVATLQAGVIRHVGPTSPTPQAGRSVW